MYTETISEGLYLFAALDCPGMSKALMGIKAGLILATTASYKTQLQGGRALKDAGFHLASGLCFWNPNFNKDWGDDHWIHVWWKKVGHLKRFQPPDDSDGWGDEEGFDLNCCGVNGMRVKGRPLTGSPMVILTASSKPLSGTWTRFCTLPGYKLSHNFSRIGGKRCPHF